MLLTCIIMTSCVNLVLYFGGVEFSRVKGHASRPPSSLFDREEAGVSSIEMHCFLSFMQKCTRFIDHYVSSFVLVKQLHKCDL